MPVVMAGDRSFEVDEEGYLMESSNWDASFAAQVAEKEGFAPLIEDHWTVINFLRDYYAHLGKAPRVRDLIRGSGFSLKRIYDLFPSGPAVAATKMAGLPKPCGCL